MMTRLDEKVRLAREAMDEIGEPIVLEPEPIAPETTPWAAAARSDRRLAQVKADRIVSLIDRLTDALDEALRSADREDLLEEKE